MENKDKAIGLFQYIKELYAIKSKTVISVEEQIWHRYVNEIPNDEENIKFRFLDRSDEDDFGSDTINILQIKKPEYYSCPSLPEELKTWVEDDWANFRVQVKKVENKKDQNELSEFIYFNDDINRITAYSNWIKERNNWIANQKRIEKVRVLYNELYHLYIDLERDEESIELMVGQGIFNCIINVDEQVNHPILIKRVKLEFNAHDCILSIVDTNASPEIYTMLLDSIEYINHSSIIGLKEELSENFYHPLDRVETLQFLKSFAHRLHADGKYEDNPDTPLRETDKITIYNNPVLFVRKRTGGVLKALDGIIGEIQETGKLSGPILNLIGENISPYAIDTDTSKDFETELSSVSGEDHDILLSKETNKEQLEIARRIENYNAVLVQGPPGTGKTHTIANLMGHFLSQGKNILVTSHTRKALTVVKEKVVPELQNLCVAVLDDDNRDMERSIDGITDYISTHNSLELIEEIKITERKRNQILEELKKTRKTIYSIKNKEYETITFGGVPYSVAQAANFVFENQDILSYLPGKVVLYKPFPVTLSDLELLYETNSKITIDEESELYLNLPNPKDLLSPHEFKKDIDDKISKQTRVSMILLEINNGIKIDDITHVLTINGEPLYRNFKTDLAKELICNINKSSDFDFPDWAVNAILEGKKGGGFRAVWDNMCDIIDDTYQYAGSIKPIIIGKNINLDSLVIKEKTLATLNEIKEYLLQGKKLNAMGYLFHKDWKELLSNIKINGNEIETANDIEVIFAYISLEIKRNDIKVLWDELIGKFDGYAFSIFGNEPELSCISFVSLIKKYLDWYIDVFGNLKECFLKCGFNEKCINKFPQYISPIEEIKYLKKFVYQLMPLYVEIAELTDLYIPEIEMKLRSNGALIQAEQSKSFICENLFFANMNEDISLYENYYHMLNELYQKYFYYEERKRVLEQIADYAPEWALMIENRIGIHGDKKPPLQIEDAWLWKQFAGIINEITELPFEELQHKMVRLNQDYRLATAKLAECKSWYHLIARIENDLSQKQALQGWKLTARKIGKGTGKNASKYIKESQRLMAKCQKAVPAWIMPVNKALESLDPAKNKFDIIIIDEASQSDISALAIFYMAKKIIVVGDDEQVSPSAIGVDVNKMNALIDMYIKGIIPNSHLYDMKSSLYDIAKTTFQPLMLKEHFRCVPSIIGYSNRLSYDYKIKPLRDDSSVTIKPATISFRVDGHREGSKTNLVEARNIVALMIACMKEPEYDGMTFGVVSLLGDEQAKLINNIAIEKIAPNDYKNRKILCGNASHFQGDERDVIFISLVDSNEGEGPLRMSSEGVGKSTKQRYNVAVSRARNQLWVVHSLDIYNDLKLGDMRKDLIEYVSSPSSFEEQQKRIRAKADSPFEISVASNLTKQGFNIVQQWCVGSYRIDMVAVCGDRKIAIECDGELYHSEDNKVRDDMERQAILERLGWKFIRIRGSEYYSNPELTIQRVISELQNNSIVPENNIDIGKIEETEIKQRVIISATKIMDSWSKEKREEQ